MRPETNNVLVRNQWTSHTFSSDLSVSICQLGSVWESFFGRLPAGLDPGQASLGGEGTVVGSRKQWVVKTGR